MTGIPAAAITAAMTAVMDHHGQLEADGADVIAYEMGEFRADVETALKAAAPHIAAAERDRIRQALEPIAKLYADAGIKDARPVLNDVRALLTEGDPT